MHEKVENIETDLPSIMHENVKNSPTVYCRSEQKFGRNSTKRMVENNLLGTYETARGYDAGNIYTGKNKPLNFHDSETYSGALPPVSVEDLRVSSIAQFVKRQAVRALDDPAWKRTYEESY
ncbi:unnamed protein product [Sphagnum jensenii]|uniref:Uncharacterized protein n=1 Tax=Sphagnum jensenii TaxID=128206 RepID=A0ABP1A4A4_9BRYO